jgi:hypothetical protein
MKIKHTNPDGSVVDVDVGFCCKIGADFRAGASREDLARRYRITVLKVEAAIAFPW